MPTYDYVCHACGKEFEYFQSMKDPHLETCIDESCGGKVKRKLGTGAGIIFKGSGFYETDYRSESYKSAAKADAGASSSGGDSGSSGGSSSSGSSSGAGSSGSGSAKSSD